MPCVPSQPTGPGRCTRMTGVQEGGVAVKVLYSRNVHVVEPVSAVEY